MAYEMWGVIDMGRGDPSWVIRIYICTDAQQARVVAESLVEDGHKTCFLEPGDFFYQGGEA